MADKSQQGAHKIRTVISWKPPMSKSIQGQNAAWCKSTNHVAVLWINSPWPILSVTESDCWQDGSGSVFTLSFPVGWGGHLFTHVWAVCNSGAYSVCVHIGVLWQVNQWGVDAVSCWFIDPLCWNRMSEGHLIRLHMLPWLPAPVAKLFSLLPSRLVISHLSLKTGAGISQETA